LTSKKDRRNNNSNKSGEKSQTNWMMWGGAAVVVVAIVIVAFVALSPAEETGPVEESVLVTGGSLIGDPNAPVTLVEFGDFQ
jgi:protein-disulfide isomerase